MGISNNVEANKKYNAEFFLGLGLRLGECGATNRFQKKQSHVLVC
jgi:hypothetical protein